MVVNTMCTLEFTPTILSADGLKAPSAEYLMGKSSTQEEEAVIFGLAITILTY